MSDGVYFPVVSYDIAIGASSTQAGQAIGPGITVIRLCVSGTAAAYVNIGTNPTAAKPGGLKLAPNWPEYVGVVPGSKVAVIQDAAGGTFLTVTEMCG
jgi:hypothetical protein